LEPACRQARFSLQIGKIEYFRVIHRILGGWTSKWL